MANTKSWQKVLFIGDSLTRGYDVPYGKGWVELLKAYFEKARQLMKVQNYYG